MCELPAEGVRGAGDGIEKLLPHGLEGGVPRQLHHEHAGLHSQELQVRILVALVMRCNLHRVRRRRDPSCVSGAHWKAVLVAGKLYEPAQLLL